MNSNSIKNLEKKEEIGKNNAEIKAYVESLADLTFEQLDDNKTVIGNQTCCDSVSGQRFKIEKD